MLALAMSPGSWAASGDGDTHAALKLLHGALLSELSSARDADVPEEVLPWMTK